MCDICRNDLIWLQFRIIQRILGTRAHLHKININNCTFCQSFVETIYHLSAACPIVIYFWRNVTQWLQSLGMYLNLTPITLLFGVFELDMFPKNLTLLVKNNLFGNVHEIKNH